MTAPAPVRFHAAGPRVPKRAPALRFGAVRRTTPAGVLPAIPDSLDYLAHLSDWQLFANDTIGDCAAITWANDRRLITTGLTATPAYPSLEDVLAVYRTQNPQFDPAGDPALNGPGSPADGGMDLQTLLEYLHSNGGPDGVAPVAFASVDVTNEEELSAAVAIFGNLWLGILVQDAQQEQFAAGQPWSWVDGSPVEGGHAVLAGGYDPASKKVVTWGQEVSLEGAGFLGGALEEAWVVIWPEHLGSVGFLTGVDLGQLASSYEALTGRSLPLPPTPVIPSPVTPAPVVDPEPVVPIVDPVPVPDPVVDPAPVVDPSPAPEPAPVVVDPAPVPDPAPAPLDPPVTPEPVTPDPEPVPAPVEPDPVIVDPAPVVDPAPAVDPIPAPVDPTPVVDPAPVDPEPVVDPSPVVDPAPVEPDPVDPSPQPEPTPDPEPVVDPEPEPEPTPEPEPVVDPEPPLPDALRDYPWKAADAFVRNPHHPLAAERFRGKLLEWAATLPV